MGVQFQQGGGGLPNPKQFTDSFDRANKSTLGSNWLRSLFNNAGGAGSNPASGAAAIVGNTATMTTTSGAAPTLNFLPAWVPIPVYRSLYNQRGVFVQASFQSAAGAGSALILRYNHDLNNTQTQGEGSDCYLCILPGAAGGRIDKIVGGGAETVIGAGATTLAAGDIIRMEVLTNAAGNAVQIQTMVNGTIIQTITDATATAILAGVPGMMFTSISATGQTFVLNSFACGALSALST